MKITFQGAAHEVTGSCFQLSVCGKEILVDCGMRQGAGLRDQQLRVNAADIDCVLLTHAHIDHSGLLPLLYKRGFRGEIFATGATCDLCSIMLRDSAHIQEFEAEWKSRKGKRSGKGEVEPLYDSADAEGAISLLRPMDYGKEYTLFSGVVVKFTDVGHLLGSSSIEVFLEEDGVKKKLIFSGDIGNLNQPIIKDPQYLDTADYVIMESTYGDRSHGPVPDYVGEFTKIIQRTFDRGGNVVVPSFAVGRTQEMLYFLRQIKQDGLIKGHDGFKVYVDSPLANEATTVFNKNVRGYYDEEAMELIKSGINPLTFPGLVTAISAEESKAINFDADPKIIISASGMCEAGRIRHHLKHNLWRKESTILFVGYQAVGTLGRTIIEGAESVKLFGEQISVKSEIVTLSGISGHADHEGLIRWLTNITPKPERVFVVHGDNEVCEKFATELSQSYGYSTVAQFPGTQYDLALNVCTEYGEPLKPKEAPARRFAPAYQRLIAAVERLSALIRRCDGFANKDIAKIADSVNNICDKIEKDL